MWTLCGLVKDINFSEDCTVFIVGVVEQCALPKLWQPLADYMMP